MRKETSTCEIIFSIVKIINKTYRHDAIYSEISDELNYFKNDIDRNRKSVQQISESDSFRETGNDRPDRQQCTNDRRISKKPRFLSR